MRSDRDFLREDNFDALLEESVSCLPPPDMVVEITPWRRAMSRIIVGTALSLLTLNFLYLQYLLPAIGSAMIVLGFRALRRENGLFRACYVLAVLRCITGYMGLILNATIYPLGSDRATFDAVVIGVGLAAQLLLYLCLWRGLLAVQKKAGLPPTAPAAGGILVWQIALIALALVEYQGLLILGAMVVLYLLMLCSLSKLSGTLDDAGYAVEPAPVRFSDKKVTWLVAAVLALGIICGQTFGQKYLMDWQVRHDATTAETESVRGELVALGYPEDVLADLSTDDLMACQGALQVVVDREGRREWVSENLHVTHVGVQIPGDDRWRIFHHFRWDGTTQFYGTESMKLWTTYSYHGNYWAAEGAPAGRVLYDEDGVTYTAPYYTLAEESYTAASFFGSSYTTDLFADFSLPSGDKDQRGYVSYGTHRFNKDSVLLDSWCNYTHQKNPVIYPAITAKKARQTYWSNDAGGFVTVQTALQCHINAAGQVEDL